MRYLFLKIVFGGSRLVISKDRKPDNQRETETFHKPPFLRARIISASREDGKPQIDNKHRTNLLCSKELSMVASEGFYARLGPS